MTLLQRQSKLPQKASVPKGIEQHAVSRAKIDEIHERCVKPCSSASADTRLSTSSRSVRPFQSAISSTASSPTAYGVHLPYVSSYPGSQQPQPTGPWPAPLTPAPPPPPLQPAPLLMAPLAFLPLLLPGMVSCFQPRLPYLHRLHRTHISTNIHYLEDSINTIRPRGHHCLQDQRIMSLLCHGRVLTASLRPTSHSTEQS